MNVWKYLPMTNCELLVVPFKDTLEPGSAVKVVDCILALKSYHEMKNGVNGSYRHARSPMVIHAANRPLRALSANPSDSCRRLDMSAACQKEQPVDVTGLKSLFFISVSCI